MTFENSLKNGIICSLLFENESIGLAMTHFLSITINLESFQFQNQCENTCIQLDFIEIPFNSFSDIENKSFEFPINPEEGYIDGSVYLDNQHIPVDVTNISFKTFNANKINGEITGKILFEYGGYKISDYVFKFDIELIFDKILIPPNIIQADEGNLEIAKNELSNFFSLKELSEPKIKNNGVQDAIVFLKSI